MTRGRAGATLVLLLAIAACSGVVRGPARPRLSPKEIVERSKPAIVRIQHAGGVGTGFIVDSHGRIATNLHVLRGAREAKVVLLDGSEFPVVQVMGVDEQRDLAIVSIDAERLPTLPLGDSDAVAAGDPVLAIGNPLGVLDYTVSDGLISSVRRLDASLTIIQISAPISEGSSGGPLFNMYGEVIGVATLISTAGQNLNFGVPSNYLRPLMSGQRAETLTALSERLARHGAEPGADAGGGGRACRVPPITRRVPQHDVALLDGCPEEVLLDVAEQLTGAINNGAPLYNECQHEACYRIYEGVALRLERDLAECRGVRDALGQGLLRASTLSDNAEKAWAMRDAFDGLLDVIMRRLAPRH